MRRGFRWIMAAALGLTGWFGAPTNAHALAQPLGQFLLHANGDTVFVFLPAGVYTVQVRGVYNYDNERPGLHFADAECSNDHVFSQELVDYLGHDGLGIGYGSLYPSPLSEWQRYRYTVSLSDPNHTPFWSGNALDDTLDVYVDGHPVDWTPLAPTPIDAGPGVDAGCDSATHTYSTVVTSFGEYHTFRIYDLNYGDNADANGGLTALISQLL